MQQKIDMAQHVEEQFQALHSQGKMKMSEDGTVHIVDDPEEQNIFAETARKNREQQMAGQIQEMQDSEQIRDEVRQNLLEKLDQVVDDIDEDEFE